MMRLAYTTSVFLLIGSSAFAHGDCSEISESAERLACFDTAHEVSAASSEPEPAAADTGAWDIDIEKNALTDRTDVYIGIDAKETMQCGYQTTRPTLYLRCMDNTTAALLVTSCFMADIQGYGKVRYRVDDGPMRSRNFVERTDNMALGLWSYGRSTPFIKQLLGGEKLIMEYTPYNDIPKTSTFDIKGVDAALKPLREACGW